MNFTRCTIFTSWSECCAVSAVQSLASRTIFSHEMRVRRRCHLFCSRKNDFRINPVSYLPCLNLLASDFIVDSEIKKKARHGLEPSGCSVKQRGPAVSAAGGVRQERTSSPATCSGGRSTCLLRSRWRDTRPAEGAQWTRGRMCMQ